ncbi:MAG: GNAT family N-acetyltransferase [Phycisphaerae bacterium]|nr:GNAT family N-acetyltransferase [Phycisphaerae bacterium]
MARIGAREFAMKGGVCVVRSPEEHEAAAVLECARDVFATSAFTLTQSDEFTYSVEQEADLIRQRAADPHALFIVACEGTANGRMIGISNVWPGPKRKVRHVGTIGMSVHSAYRFRGIGKAMMRAMVDWGESVATLHMLDLAVYAANTPARKLYESFGFVQHAYLPDGCRHDDGSLWDQISMHRMLHRAGG